MCERWHIWLLATQAAVAQVSQAVAELAAPETAAPKKAARRVKFFGECVSGELFLKRDMATIALGHALD